MSAEENKAIVRRLFDEVFNKGNLGEADAALAPNYRLHDPAAPNFAGGREAYRQFQARYLKAFPDHRLTVEDQIAEGHRVATRWTARGTHRGDLPGIPATGKPVTVTGITISRMSGGKIAEEWQDWDGLGMLQQLGVVPAHPGAGGKRSKAVTARRRATGKRPPGGRTRR